MANLSYCRFQNTLEDLKDCEDALLDIADLEDLSPEEQTAAVRLLKLCAKLGELAESYGVDVNE